MESLYTTESIDIRPLEKPPESLSIQRPVPLPPKPPSLMQEGAIKRLRPLRRVISQAVMLESEEN